jgi:DNA topoisomerase-1
MAKNLVIVESLQSETIENFWVVIFKWSQVGHIADLPSKEMGVDVEHGLNLNMKSSDKRR